MSHSSPRVAVIAIHGLGDGKPGEIAAEVTAAMGISSGLRSSRSLVFPLLSSGQELDAHRLNGHARSPAVDYLRQPLFGEAKPEEEVVAKTYDVPVIESVAHATTVYEVNWHDVERPSEGIQGLLTHFGRILAVLPAVAQEFLVRTKNFKEERYEDCVSQLRQPVPASQKVPPTVAQPSVEVRTPKTVVLLNAWRWATEGCFLGSALLMVAAVLLEVGLQAPSLVEASSISPQIIALVLGFLALGLGLSGRKHHPAYWLVFLSGLLISIVSLPLFVTSTETHLQSHAFPRLARLISEAALLAPAAWKSSALLNLTLSFAFFLAYLFGLGRRVRIPARIGILAILTFAFVGINVSITLLISGIDVLVPGFAGQPAFSYLSDRWHSLALYILILAVPVLIAVIYSLRRFAVKQTWLANQGGETSRRMVRYGLLGWGILTPVCVFMSGGLSLLAIWDPEILPVFKSTGANSLSASVRFLSLLLPLGSLLLGAIGSLANIIGDLAFYLNPTSGNAAFIKSTCRMRLRAVIDLLEVQQAERVVILAHSLGSLIAHDVLRWKGLFPQETAVHLVTLGSPLGVLTGRFLDRRVHPLLERSVTRWDNLYRDGDPIGGPICSPNVQNHAVGPGGHTGYWSTDWISWLSNKRSKGAEEATP